MKLDKDNTISKKLSLKQTKFIDISCKVSYFSAKFSGLLYNFFKNNYNTKNGNKENHWYIT